MPLSSFTLRTMWAVRAGAMSAFVLCAIFLRPAEVQAADAKLFFESQFTLIFSKIYVSSLYGRPQPVPGDGGWCEHEIGRDAQIPANEQNREILSLIPLKKIDQRSRDVLQKYTFWPFYCSPLYVSEVTLGIFDQGHPRYIKADFLPTIHCGEFIEGMKHAIATGSINDLIIWGLEYERIGKFYGEYYSSTIDMISNRDNEEPIFFNNFLKLLQSYKMIIDCENATIEFK